MTKNLKQRIDSHNTPTNKGWTNTKGPWKLLYTEVYQTQTEALSREKFLKSLKAGSKIKDILNIPR